ncbi:hypothetical protein BH20CHL6_BH20CHL6_01470 [soil metagenome]
MTSCALRAVSLPLAALLVGLCAARSASPHGEEARAVIVRAFLLLVTPGVLLTWRTRALCLLATRT